MSAGLDAWFLDHLVCPRDHCALAVDGPSLVCAGGHRYPVVDGVPVMLIDEELPAIDISRASLTAARQPNPEDPLFLVTLSLTEAERRGIAQLAGQGSAIDPAVAYLVAATNGLMYKHLIGDLHQYPIPSLPLPAGEGRRLLDIGCSWGRWTLAASERGYEAVGIDPSLGAIMAARRVARALGRPARFVVGDARYLPFAPASMTVTYSYSVLQHFSYEDAARAIGEMGRVLKPCGMAKVQMPTRYGLRCVYQQARRRFRAAQGFEVRYWTWPRLERAFTNAVGSTRFDVDCYFGIGLQRSDAHLMPPRLRGVLRASELMKALARTISPLRRVADSVFVEATKASPTRA
jgi:SAM-dependent methyltransferase/uncharacterized protein YbaR (Trm112 family)